MRVLSIWFAEISCQGRSRNLATWRQSEGCNIQAAQTQLRAKTTKEIVKGRENATTWSSSSISQCNHHLKVPCSRITSIGALSFRTSADVAKLPRNIGDSETLFLVSFVSTCFFVFCLPKTWWPFLWRHINKKNLSSFHHPVLPGHLKQFRHLPAAEQECGAEPSNSGSLVGPNQCTMCLGFVANARMTYSNLQQAKVFWKNRRTIKVFSQNLEVRLSISDIYVLLD